MQSESALLFYIMMSFAYMCQLRSVLILSPCLQCKKMEEIDNWGLAKKCEEEEM